MLPRTRGQRGQRLGQRVLDLAVQAAGQGQRGDEPVADPLGVRDGGGEVASRPSPVSPRWKQITAAMPRSQQAAPGSLQVVVQGRPPRPARRPSARSRTAAGPGRCAPGSAAWPCRPGWPATGPAPAAVKRLVVPVEVAQRDGLVDLQQQPQVGQPAVGLGHGQRPVEQRQRVRHVPLHPGHDRQHVQRPGHGPVVGRLGGRLERAGGHPAGLLDLAEVQVRPRGEHQQPGAVPGRDPGRGQRLGPARPATPRPSPPACGTAPASSAGPRARSGSAAYSSARLATCSASASVAHPVEGVGEPAGQPAVPDRAGRGAGDGPGEELGGDPGRLVDQRVRGAGQPVEHPLVHRPGQAARARRRPAAAGGRPGRAGRRPRPGRGRRRDARRPAPGSASRRTARPGSAGAGTPAAGRTRPARPPRTPRRAPEPGRPRRGRARPPGRAR